MTRRPSRSLSSRAILLSILTLLPLITAVSLSDFQPAINPNLLPANCARAYTAVIPSCQKADFPTNQSRGTVCSTSCIQGLAQVESSLRLACSNVDLPETSLLAFFLFGKGIEILCGTPIARTTIISTSTPSGPDARPTSLNPDAGAGESGGLLMDTRSGPEPPMRTPPVVATTTLDTSVGGGDSSSETSGDGSDLPIQTATGAPPGDAGVAPGGGSTSGAPRSTQEAKPQSGGGGSPFELSTAGQMRVGNGGWVVMIAGICASVFLG
ncbi:hypothetical protein P152DRAFT_471888 [Eremomyces bilateralis CBS 781.70]|uniref:Extracellular membrane protein CFEM domain-containing protein n=1 Tax=Eremomyces bilateralis CBS 781.70 TaxID=1392243 RepID=A0A6G1GBB7_9PEZI|nr:uncharacterized protein P152DRAFT_471888 [Eremomyces bilateralis CBS 781.70]KAF1815272.1 hypothetical protein P152DRAFT_471888 [Eremomyces bilateralis CBS 781.70]